MAETEAKLPSLYIIGYFATVHVSIFIAIHFFVCLLYL